MNLSPSRALPAVVNVVPSTQRGHRLTRRHGIAATVTAALALFVAVPGTEAATITWNAAQQIAAATDAITNGSLVGAANLGGGATTVNGVNFQSLAASNGASSGIFTISGFFFGGANTSSAAAPFSSLAAGYQALLGTAAAVGGTMTLTMSGLTLGHNYQFQAWVNDSRNQTPPGFTFKVNVAAGNNVTLDPNTSLNDGGLGQFVIGSFLADGTSQQVTFENSEVAIINGFQLRDQIAAAPQVPEPGSFALLGLGIAGLFVSRRVSRSR